MSSSKANKWKKLGIPVIVAVRLVLPPLLWWNAFAATILVLLADLADGEVFRRAFSFKKNDSYQLVDKGLDFYWYCFALVYSVRFPAFKLILFLFFFRAVGAVLLLIKKDRRILVFFPNVFENLFIFYVILLTFPSLTSFLGGSYPYYVGLLISIGLKIPQEYLLHVKQLQLYELLIGKRWV